MRVLMLAVAVALLALSPAAAEEDLTGTYKLDDRFHEASIGGANRGGTERMLVDSSFEELNEERQHGNMAASA